MDDLTFTVSEFVAVFNQTINYAYPNVIIEGELSSLRVNKNRWVYFDLKDDEAIASFFGTSAQLPGPIEDGMMVRVRGVPVLHSKYGFNINVISIKPTGEGSIKRAAKLLEAKLRAEGLFDITRKRKIPYPIDRIGLITSAESAAFHDFIKIIGERWGGLEVLVADVQVQGENAPQQIARAIEEFNAQATPVDALVIIRGGGSVEDLSAFNSEIITRSVALSRIPTVLAIGHEIDVSLAELAADIRGSTPTHAAEILVPDKKQISNNLIQLKTHLDRFTNDYVGKLREDVVGLQKDLINSFELNLQNWHQKLFSHKLLLEALNPSGVLKRGYAIIKKQGQIVTSGKNLVNEDLVEIQLVDSEITALVKGVKLF